MVLCAFTRLFMPILTVNTGSSSVRLAAFARSDNALTELATVRHDLAAGGDPRVMLSEFRQTHGLSGIDVSVHRVVQGGANLTASRLLDQEVEREIDRLTPLAPLHNPVSLRWIRAVREAFGTGVTQVAVFAQKYAVRRYGFHGLAHQAMWRKWCDLQPAIPHGGRMVSLQLGAGCSITAIDNGLPRDTSMGFSPLEGLMMANYWNHRMSARVWRWIYIVIGHVNIWAPISRCWVAPKQLFLAEVWARTCRLCGKKFWLVWSGAELRSIRKKTMAPAGCCASAAGQAKSRYGLCR